MEGILSLKHDSVDYVMFDKGNSFNLSEKLNCILLEKVRLHIEDKSGVLFSGEGRLIKKKVSGYVYDYFVGKKNVGTILWNKIGSKVKIKVKCIEDYGGVMEAENVS